MKISFTQSFKELEQRKEGKGPEKYFFVKTEAFQRWYSDEAHCKGLHWNLEPTTGGNKRFSFLKKTGKLLAIDTGCVKYTVKTVGLNSKTSHVKMYDSLLDPSVT